MSQTHRCLKKATSLIVAGLLVLVVAGCPGARSYTAKTLPVEYNAPVVENAQTVDLSNFGGPPVRNDMVDRGDLIRVSVAAGLDATAVTNFYARVGDDGMATLPEIGSLELAGLDVVQAEQQIVSACITRGLYRSPTVTVNIDRHRVNRVTVVGAVEEAGIHDLPRNSSYLLAALVSAGGLADDAGTKVEIRQPNSPSRLASDPTSSPWPVQQTSATEPIDGAHVVCLNLSDAATQVNGGYYLQDGAVVRVERRVPDPVQVVGLVSKPGAYEFPVNHELRLIGAVAEAGGLSSKAADKVLVIRKNPQNDERAVINVSISAAKQDPEQNIRLAPGDIVSVEQTLPTVVLDIATRVLRFGIGGSLLSF